MFSLLNSEWFRRSRIRANWLVLIPRMMESVHPSLLQYLSEDVSDATRAESAHKILNKLQSGELTVPGIVSTCHIT
jgi:hypothetical protein